MFDNTYFKFNNKYYKQYGSMIQGSISGRDASNLVLVINEIKNKYYFDKYLKFFGRFADDVVMIINDKTRVENKNNIINILKKLYNKFTFDITMKDKESEICDINIKLENNKLNNYQEMMEKLELYYEIIKFKQSINSIRNCLQERYIIINQNYHDYFKMKKIIFNVLLDMNGLI